jgi:hypothetical protein
MSDKLSTKQKSSRNSGDLGRGRRAPDIRQANVWPGYRFLVVGSVDRRPHPYASDLAPVRDPVTVAKPPIPKPPVWAILARLATVALLFVVARPVLAAKPQNWCGSGLFRRLKISSVAFWPVCLSKLDFLRV